jgi:hypothetical protein
MKVQMVARRLPCVLFFSCCLLSAAAAVEAQTVTATLRLQATAVNVSGALVWQVNMQFTPADIAIDAETIDTSLSQPCPQISVALRNRLLKELAVMAKEETNSLKTSTPLHFYIDSSSPSYSLSDALSERAFFGRLDRQLTNSINRDPALGLAKTPPAGFGAPTRAGETLADRNQTQWRFELNPMGFAMVGYQLWLQTKKAADNDANGGTTVPVAKTMGNIADDLGITSVSAAERSVPINLVYAPEDLQKPDGTSRTETEVIRELEGAAYRSFLILRDAQVQGCGFRDADIDQIVKNNTEALFNAYGADLNVGSMLSDDNQEIFGVSGLQFVQDVRISVTPEPDPQGNTTITDRDKAIQELLNKREKPRLLAHSGQILTNEILDTVWSSWTPEGRGEADV